MFRLIRQEPARSKRDLVHNNLGKPKAVPGGKWAEGSNVVTAWITDEQDQEKGSWEERPMRHCSVCGIENHLVLCLECTDIRGTDGKFNRICVQCKTPFNTSNTWKIICSHQCRLERQVR